MRSRLALVPLVIVALSPCAAPAVADAGGATYVPPAGGAAYGAESKRVATHPVAASFVVGPSRVHAGSLPSVRFLVSEYGTPSVSTRVAIRPLSNRTRPLNIVLGSQPTGRTVVMRWPRGTKLPVGRYLVQLHAKDAAGHNLLRQAHASGSAVLTVVPAPKPAPKPTPAPTPAPAPLPTPAPATGVFPVAGPHTYGDGFGVGRSGHTHQGQDILASSGTPVVAPVAGSIESTAYQAGGAGYYIVEHAIDGRDFFFAHCLAGSTAVSTGATVVTGQQLCAVGMTGDATGPHLHFEIWPDGWHAPGSRPIDPLPQLQAWDA